MTQALDFHTLKALLEWQIDLGATEAIGDAPINRFEAPAKAPQPIRPQDPAPQDLPTPPPQPTRPRSHKHWPPKPQIWSACGQL